MLMHCKRQHDAVKRSKSFGVIADSFVLTGVLVYSIQLLGGVWTAQKHANDVTLTVSHTSGLVSVTNFFSARSCCYRMPEHWRAGRKISVRFHGKWSDCVTRPSMAWLMRN
jgi:hypothetical protein